MITAIKDSLQGKTPSLTHKRSSQWPKIRKNFLLKNSKCAVCNGTKKLEVHHIKPFHQAPELELDENNLITLCEDWSYGLNCHLLVGHLGNYRNINPSVQTDAKTWQAKLCPTSLSQ
jgi:predicted HNH restriction endonuclease